jgi:predicted RNA-binding Zn-ribbon protein involved in translation (DUF1610 family)
MEILDNGIQHCKHCKCDLQFESFKTTKFRQYCPTCSENEIWKSNYSTEQLKARGNKISTKKLEFFKSDRGKETARIVGDKNSIKLKQYFQTEDGKNARLKSSEHNSKIMKSKILDGTFTPNTKNSRTHFQIQHDGMSFRSSWECMWYELNKQLLYENIRIPYVYNGNSHAYIVDFEDPINKILYEIKPAEHLLDSKFQAKQKAAEEWAKNNEYEYKIITQYELVQYEDVLLNSTIPINVKHKLTLLCKQLKSKKLKN